MRDSRSKYRGDKPGGGSQNFKDSRRRNSRDGGESRSDKPNKSKFDKDSRPKRPYRKDEESDARSSKPYRKKFDSDERPSKKYGSRDRFQKAPFNKKRNEKQVQSGKKNDDLRLNKFIANAGICSRREADDYIKAGLVTVNGKIVTEMGIRVNITDEVRFNGERIKAEKKVYLVLNKPKDYVTTLEDPQARKTVLDLIRDACDERIYPVGRLDRNTTGVLLFTNDGDLAKRLTHPKYDRKKIYHVVLNKPVTQSHMNDILNGITLEDGKVWADALSYANEDDKREVGIEIHSGKNRIIRRIFEHLGYKVEKLDRVYFAGLTKKGIPRGKWRFLSEQELNMLRIGRF